MTSQTKGLLPFNKFDLTTRSVDVFKFCSMAVCFRVILVCMVPSRLTEMLIESCAVVVFTVPGCARR